MQASGGWIETGIYALLRLEQFGQRVEVGVLMDQPAPLQFTEDILCTHLLFCLGLSMGWEKGDALRRQQVNAPIHAET